MPCPRAFGMPSLLGVCFIAKSCYVCSIITISHPNLFSGPVINGQACSICRSKRGLVSSGRPLLDLRVSVTGGVHFDLVKRVLRDISRSGQAPEEIIQQVRSQQSKSFAV